MTFTNAHAGTSASDAEAILSITTLTHISLKKVGGKAEGANRMADQIQEKIDIIIDLARHDGAGALLLADELVEAFPTDYRTWDIRSYAHAHYKNINGAIRDMEHAIELNKFEPVGYWKIGRLQIAKKSYEDSVISFSKSISISDSLDFLYYKEDSLILRAFSYCKLKNFSLAISDIENLKFQTETWIENSMVSKEEIYKICIREI